jgi:hypothetical protein
MVRSREITLPEQVVHQGRKGGPATESHGGIMRIRRAIMPVALALSLAGSVVAGSAISVAAARAPTTHTQVVAATYFHD